MPACQQCDSAISKFRGYGKPAGRRTRPARPSDGRLAHDEYTRHVRRYNAYWSYNSELTDHKLPFIPTESLVFVQNSGLYCNNYLIVRAMQAEDSGL